MLEYNSVVLILFYFANNQDLAIGGLLLAVCSHKSSLTDSVTDFWLILTSFFLFVLDRILRALADLMLDSHS